MKRIGEVKEQSFLDHLEVLRWHLIRSAIAILVGTVVTFLFPEILFDKIIFAAKDPSFPTYKAFCWISESLGLGQVFCIMNMPFTLMNINMSGQFSTHIMSSLIAGFIIAFP